ncbi:MAG: two-component system sensor histidine kinase DctS [Hydrogenophaga sp.]|jgi:two-component system sensor histidine kinase DctS
MDSNPDNTPFDFDLLQRPAGAGVGRVRRAAFWLLGLLALLVVAVVVSLVLYLQRFETEEDLRRQSADAQWLEQGARFHFSRLEDDLQVLAHRTREAPGTAAMLSAVNAGLLLREPGVVQAQGWLPAQPDALADRPIARRLLVDAADPVNAEMLAVMQDVASGLRRPAYAGPMRAIGQPGQVDAAMVVWLAVPLFDEGRFSGSYLARLSLRQAVDAFIPVWFKDQHEMGLLDGLQRTQAGRLDERSRQAALDLPGTDLALRVRTTTVDAPTVPRTFFLVALVCLLGMLAALYALRLDFQKRQRVERALQAQVALRSAMENAATIGLRAWDLKGRILYVNRAFCRMVGFEPDELLGRSAPMPYWPTHQVAELDLLHRDVIAQGTEEAGIEVQFQHKTGHLVDVLIHEAPLNTADGQPLGWMSSVLDISERKHAERIAARQQQKLEASGRLVAMGEVASTLAHELNQPLGALSGFAAGLVNRLKADRIDPEEVLRVAERMEQLAAKSGRIIQRVGAFARRREMTRQRMDLVPLVRRLVEPLQTAGGLSLRLSWPAAPVFIDGDALLLEHAVRNLLANASHWAGQSGAHPAWVGLSVCSAGGFAELAVTDSGPGVAPEGRDQIFGAFFSGRADGMGMGLAICRSVVEAHRGQIEVGVDPSGGGACFTLKLPLSEDSDL